MWFSASHPRIDAGLQFRVILSVDKRVVVIHRRYINLFIFMNINIYWFQWLLYTVFLLWIGVCTKCYRGVGTYRLQVYLNSSHYHELRLIQFPWCPRTYYCTICIKNKMYTYISLCPWKISGRAKGRPVRTPMPLIYYLHKIIWYYVLNFLWIDYILSPKRINMIVSIQLKIVRFN